MARKQSFDFKVLIKEESGMWIAHCLELDIVATAESLEQVENDINDLVATQLRYAVANENLDCLYHAAPPEVWREFFACDKRRKMPTPMNVEPVGGIVPRISMDTCLSETACHA